MKFANIIFNRSGRLTIGDDMQLLAIEYLYKHMGVDYNNVERIPFHQLYDYDGEYVVLPISFPLYGYNHDIAITQFSPKIIPVFLGFATLTNHYSQEEVTYLKRYEPIGCRDVHTLNTLRKYNILAYLNGCITAVFPHCWQDDKEKKKIFCIDIDEKLKNYIPEELLPECIFSSHTFYSSELPNGAEEKAKELYEKYIREAKMIITTRLHAALPCMAAGIPVIFAKDYLSFRFAGVDRLLHVYTQEEYENINWNPEPVYYEEVKKKMLDTAATRLFEVYNKYKLIYEVSDFYESRENRDYYIEFYDNTIEYIQNRFQKEESFEYVLWGVTQTAELVHTYLSEHYKNAKLVAVIDKVKRCEFCGLIPCSKEYIYDNLDKFYFVCTGAAIRESSELFRQLGKVKHYQCCMDGNIHKYETLINARK